MGTAAYVPSDGATKILYQVRTSRNSDACIILLRADLPWWNARKQTATVSAFIKATLRYAKPEVGKRRSRQLGVASRLFWPEKTAGTQR